MISIPGSLSFANLVMMSSTPAESAGGCQIRVPRSINLLFNTILTLSVLGVCSFYIEHNQNIFQKSKNYTVKSHVTLTCH